MCFDCNARSLRRRVMESFLVKFGFVLRNWIRSGTLFSCAVSVCLTGVTVAEPGATSDDSKPAQVTESHNDSVPVITIGKVSQDGIISEEAVPDGSKDGDGSHGANQAAVIEQTPQAGDPATAAESDVQDSAGLKRTALQTAGERQTGSTFDGGRRRPNPDPENAHEY